MSFNYSRLKLILFTFYRSLIETESLLKFKLFPFFLEKMWQAPFMWSVSFKYASYGEAYGPNANDA